MRADRLVATLLLLQARGRVTAAQVAVEMEVSVATARRDLEALALAGVPVYPQRGRGGGWSLVGGARTDLTGLSAEEAQALFLHVGPAAAVRPDARAALRKLVQALPATFRQDAAAAADAVVVDPARWGEASTDRLPLLDPLQTAVVRRRQLDLTYEDRRGVATQRRVHPWGLVDKDGTWYLVAGTESGRRTFRVDRITEVALTDTPAARPPDLDLVTVWDGVVDEVEQRRSTLRATIVAPAAVGPVLRDHWGRHGTVVDRLDDGRERWRVAAPMARSIAEQLAGWGATVEVEEPPEVRDELARIGAELVERYGRATPGRLVVVCGLPGAGKTTFARRIESEQGAVRMCPDEWLEAVSIDVFDESARAAIESLQWDLTRRLVATGSTVVVEWGTWARAERDELRRWARQVGAAVELHVLDEPIDVLWARVQVRDRERHVGHRALTRADLDTYATLFELPDAAERALYDRPAERPFNRAQ